MNPAAEGAAAPPQPHRPSTSCPRHPEEAFTGFCPSCLCERLSVLDQSAAAGSAGTSRKPPSSAAAIKALFKSSGGGAGSNHRSKPANGNGNGSFFPELRRTKSFSAAKNEGFSGVFEPQRRSCDVRGRSTLYSLFHQDDGGRGTASFCNRGPSSSSIPAGPELETAANRPEAEIEPEPHRIEESEIEIDPDNHQNQNEEEDDCKVRAFEEANVAAVHEIEEEEKPESHQEPEETENRFTKLMKEHIDMDSQTAKKPRDLKELVGSFWTRLQKWRSKQKKSRRHHHHGGGSATLPVEKPMGRQFRETQSEIADYGFGRRSCDTDPRFSLDAGRISFDDPRYSFDEPRPSWDGYLINNSRPRFPTMLSVVEDAPAVLTVPRPDSQIPLEENPLADDPVPGGSAQTRDYYSDASRRRRSFERSTSIRKTAAAVVAEIDELKPSSISNAKVSPAMIENRENRDPRDSNSNSLRDDCSETHEIGDRRGPAAKKSRRWGKAWSIWGLIHRRGGSNRDDEDDDRYIRPNGVVSRSLSESWPELRGGGAHGAEAGQAFHRRVFRSNSSVSWRNSSSANLDRSFSSSTRITDAANGNGGNGNNGNVKLDRNRSSNSVENGLLRFYLTPGGRRTGSSGHAQSITRSVMRLY